jgi:hypothetical protein
VTGRAGVGPGVPPLVDVAWLAGRSADPATVLLEVGEDASGYYWGHLRGFFDIAPADVHEGTVDCLAWRGLTTGRSLGRYAPAGTATRAQVASFVAR